MILQYVEGEWYPIQIYPLKAWWTKQESIHLVVTKVRSAYNNDQNIGKSLQYNGNLWTT